jgi:hypothetical protein
MGITDDSTSDGNIIFPPHSWTGKPLVHSSGLARGFLDRRRCRAGFGGMAAARLDATGRFGVMTS